MAIASQSILFSVAIHADDPERLREIVRTHPYDFGCRPLAVPDGNGGFIAPAVLTGEQIDILRAEDFSVDVLFDQLTDDRSAASTIGQGDRFDGGNRAPQGLGSRERGSNTDLGGIMNVDEIGSALTGLVNEYGIPTFTPPNATNGGANPGGGLVGGINPDDYHVYFIAGVHARERGGPDQLIYFIADLLYAQKHGIGLAYGAKSFSNADVHKALGTGIVFYPLVNPDGVRWDQATDSYWRKNRNPASSVPGDPNSIGVDLNRNYDFLWDYHTHFDPGLSSSSISLASDNPSDLTFHGTAAFSEPETRNVAWVFDAFPRIRWFLDIHSAAGDMLYNWGDDEDQASDPSQSFQNPGWGHKRGLLGLNDYKEWIDDLDLSKELILSRRVVNSMQSVGGRPYHPMQSVGLYPTSGTSEDYAFSRSQTNPSLNKVYGFTMEFGYPTNFYPTLAEFQNNVIDTGAGFMEFCLAAADLGLK